MTDSQGTAALPSTIPLDLTVQALPSGRYRLTVTEVPGDLMSVDISAPFSISVLGQLADKLEGRVSITAAERDAAAKQFGETLFSAVFSGALADFYAKRRQQAINASIPLVVHVNLDKAGLFNNIPWNLLRDPAVGLIPVILSDPAPQPRRVGGARETIARPRTVAIIIPLLVIIVLAAFIGRQLWAPPSDVDLIVASIRFTPPRPAPGDVVTVVIGIKNTGTSDAGPFKWAWYETTPQQQPQPNMQDQVMGLRAGQQINVRGNFIFGWWGLYKTSAWVNFDDSQSETNFLNNFSTDSQGQVTTSDQPFEISWTRLPSSNTIDNPMDLTGKEFLDWGLTIKTDTTGSNATCLKVVPRVLVDTQASLNQLTLTLPGGAPLPSTCASLPLIFTVEHPFGSASLDFTAPAPGDYTMTVLDDAGKPLGKTKVTAANAGDSLNLRLGVLSTANDPQAVQPLAVSMRANQIIINGPGIITVQKLTLGKPTG